MSLDRLLSVCTIATVGFACKAFLRLGFCKSVKVTGLGHLLDALKDTERENGRGIVTSERSTVHNLRVADAEVISSI